MGNHCGLSLPLISKLLVYAVVSRMSECSHLDLVESGHNLYKGEDLV